MTTYCVAIKLRRTMVFCPIPAPTPGWTRSARFCKMIVYEKPGERFMVRCCRRATSISQSVREIPQVEKLRTIPDDEGITIWNAKSMFRRGARWVQPSARCTMSDAAALKQSGGLQRIAGVWRADSGRSMRLFQVYSARQLHEATPETPYFKIGESSMANRCSTGITPTRHLDEAAKAPWCPWISTLKSNLSVAYRWTIWCTADRFQSAKVVLHRREQPLLSHAARHLGPVNCARF